MQRVVVDPAQIQADQLNLTVDQRHYLQRVLRLKSGDRFLALDGQGHLWTAILQPDAAQATLTAIAPEVAPTTGVRSRITLAACLPKQGFDEVVRQVTELGVDEIVPIVSDRTVLRPSANKLQRWRRIAAEAGEQCERLTVPKVREPLAWSSWLAQESQDTRVICVARRSAPALLSVSLLSPLPAIEIAIGPEGGWTESEVTQALAHGYQPASLGGSILRAVTASVVAIGILQAGIEFANITSSNDTSL
ncbi:16S rRNA (uracil(1498)-N(3))-methyltransferase [Leptolyngbya iicbica]|uniref:Ribosomal RNA small subunit methyltransferase E n=2 Tax=Cyanophyceae TaxID=3028117 RepID=A0A4Q7EAW1_9CYAN|nr:16S rRNA (uracil(1498)-N(3))-methyltransferase [Leptolyngbya sp. LK]RZM79624.1 16S rRNA (uracil(1498)-N(3))-methyltransferase [Leptolyngbya sp. LK]